MSHRDASSPSPLLLATALACGILGAGCGNGSGGEPTPEVILARDRAADHGARAEWIKAREVLAPLVARKDAAAEDLLRAADAELANDSETERVARATPLVERAQALGADPAQLEWARYRLKA